MGTKGQRHAAKATLRSIVSVVFREQLIFKPVFHFLLLLLALFLTFFYR